MLKLALIARHVGAEGGGQFGVVALDGNVEGALSGVDGGLKLAGLRVHGGEHLENGGLAVAGEGGGGLKVRQGLSKTVAGGEGAAEVEVALAERGARSTAC